MRRPSAPPGRCLSPFATALFLLVVTLTARPLGAQISVSPDGYNVSQQQNSNASQVFGVSNLVSGQTYFRDITCTGQVTSCGSTTPQSFTAPMPAITVTYSTLGTAGGGKVLLKVYQGGGSSDTGWVNVMVGDTTKPTVQLTAPTGNVSSATPTIKLTWCDDLGLNSAARSITVNGAVVTSSFDYVTTTGTTGCAVKATSTSSTVSLNMGKNTVAAHICDLASLCRDSTLTIVRSATGVALRSELSARQNFTGSSGNLQRFFVKNTEAVARTFNVSCAYSGSVTGCSVKQPTLNIPPGESLPDTVSYNISASTGPGSVAVSATDTTYTASATIAVTAVASPAPLVSVLEMNPGTALDRERCVTIAVAKNMANECGDLRIVHPLPAITTLGRTRVPTLLYSSAHGDPKPIVAASVTLKSGVALPDSVEGVLTVNGVQRAISDWLGTNWTAGSTRRIGLGYDASGDTTGVYPYTLQVTTIYGATRNTSTVSGKLIVVNRNSSAFGAGWSLAGLERLELLADGSKLWVGGDGSVRQYTAAGTNKWVAPPSAGPDTLSYDTLTTYYSRS